MNKALLVTVATILVTVAVANRIPQVRTLIGN